MGRVRLCVTDFMSARRRVASCTPPLLGEPPCVRVRVRIRVRLDVRVRVRVRIRVRLDVRARLGLGLGLESRRAHPWLCSAR